MEFKMPKLMTSETDALTGETIVRELTADEIAQREADLKEAKERAAKEVADKTALELKKQQVLEKLGLTADEVAALLG